MIISKGVLKAVNRRCEYLWRYVIDVPDYMIIFLLKFLVSMFFSSDDPRLIHTMLMTWSCMFLHDSVEFLVTTTLNISVMYLPKSNRNYCHSQRPLPVSSIESEINLLLASIFNAHCRNISVSAVLSDIPMTMHQINGAVCLLILPNMLA